MKQKKLIPKPKKGQFITQDGICPLKSEHMSFYRCQFCNYYKSAWVTKGKKLITGEREILKFTVWCWYPISVK